MAGRPPGRKAVVHESTKVGRSLPARCADRVVKASMELGVATPFIVAADADLDAAVAK